MATKSSSTSIFFASVPDYNDLCSVTLQVQVQDSSTPSVSGNVTPSKYVGSQPQIVKCRELIFTEPCVLASPSLQQEGYIYVVLQQSVWKSGRLQARCQKMGLCVNKPMRVISPIFQACLAYTIRARLAPLWNKAGNWYMQGRDFLLSSCRVAVIDMELNVTEAEICLALRPLMAKLRQCSLIDFDVCQPVLDQFFLSKDNVISEYSIDSKWCYVLPSLKKGKVVSISHQIPSTSPFQTYRDIRRYWKNAYGYRLPECEAGVVYYNVYFPAIGPTLFTYPEYCIRKEEPVLQTRVDPVPILNAFLTDLQCKVSSVCGAAFKVTPKAQYTSTGLYPTGKEANLSQLTLSSTPPPTSVRRIPARPLTHQGFVYNHTSAAATLTQPTPTPVRSPTYPLIPGTVGDFNATFAITGRVSIPRMSRAAHTASQADQLSLRGGYTHQPPVYPNDASLYSGPAAIHQPVKQAQIPYYRPLLPKQHMNDCASFHTANTWTGTAYASPAAGKTTYCRTVAPNQYIPAVNTLSNNLLDICTVPPAPQRMIPRFVVQRPRASNYIAASTSVSRDELSARVVPTFLPTGRANLHPRSQPGASAFVSLNVASPQCTSLDRVGVSPPGKGPQVTKAVEGRVASKPAFAPCFSHKVSSQAANRPPVKKKVQQTLDAIVRKVPKAARQRNPDCNKTMKRKSKDGDDEGPTASKKARAKPKVQEGIDVQSLAINDQLSKVNTVTLATWLKDKGIPVKAKEKKADLMLKVAGFIHANSIED